MCLNKIDLMRLRGKVRFDEDDYLLNSVDYPQWLEVFKQWIYYYHDIKLVITKLVKNEILTVYYNNYAPEIYYQNRKFALEGGLIKACKELIERTKISVR